MTTALLTGFGLGFLVAAQVGPVWLLAARSVIAGRLITGIMIGLGAATIDMAYGALGQACAASLLRIRGLRLGLGLLGSAARLALAEGDPGRAALLAGTVEELRRRPGLRVWPTLRRGEAEMVAEIQHALGTEQFDQAFSAGAGLIQRHAVAIVRDQRGTGTPAS